MDSIQIGSFSFTFANPTHGALIVYCPESWQGKTIEVWPLDKPIQVFNEIVANIVERSVNGERNFSAIFPKLEQGLYELTGVKGNPKVTIFPGSVAEVDLRKIK